MPREGHDACKTVVTAPIAPFQSTCPARGTTTPLKNVFTSTESFQSTCPARGTTSRECRLLGYALDFNPRAPRGARLYAWVEPTRTQEISIHVPREGHDVATKNVPSALSNISIHVPREGHDRNQHIFDGGCVSNFNPRAPRGARPFIFVISNLPTAFQSTCPARGTTSEPSPKNGGAWISIHVPREGHDTTTETRNSGGLIFQSTCPARGTTTSAIGCTVSQTHFNPRAPRGARHFRSSSDAERKEFQSTCPARGTTHPSKSFAQVSRISIHVPREGHDSHKRGQQRNGGYFNPRAPRGARLNSPLNFALYGHFNPRAPRGARHPQHLHPQHLHRFQSTCPARGTTEYLSTVFLYNFISIHVPREGHDLLTIVVLPSLMAFQSTCPARGTTVGHTDSGRVQAISIHVPREGHDR